MLRNRIIGSLVLIALLLSGCSDDGDDAGNDGSLTGYLMPGGLSGLPYATESRSGLTGSNGEFSYLAGETVTFRIGDLVLADRVVAKQYMTTLDFEADLTAIIDVGEVDKLLSLHENLEREATDDNRVTNKLNLLFSLDEDRDRETGLQISANTRETIESDQIAGSVVFDISPDDFIAPESAASILVNGICFPQDQDCTDGVGRSISGSSQSLAAYLEDRYFDIATRIFLRPEIFQINAGDTRIFTVSAQILGLYGNILQMEVTTADELAQLTETPPPVQKSVVGIDSFSAESGTVTFFAAGVAGDETEIIINIKLDNDYRWFKKVVRVQLI